MQGGVINSITTYARPLTVKRADPQLTDALAKVPAAMTCASIPIGVTITSPQCRLGSRRQL